MLKASAGREGGGIAKIKIQKTEKNSKNCKKKKRFNTKEREFRKKQTTNLAGCLVMALLSIKCFRFDME